MELFSVCDEQGGKQQERQHAKARRHPVPRDWLAIVYRASIPKVRDALGGQHDKFLWILFHELKRLFFPRPDVGYLAHLPIFLKFFLVAGWIGPAPAASEAGMIVAKGEPI